MPIEAIRWRVRCMRCKRQFSWQGSRVEEIPPGMHPTCVTKAKHRRAKIGPLPCPTPDKRCFDDQRDAQVFIAQNFGRNEMLNAYRCRCLKVHIGHVAAVCEAKKIDGQWIINPEEKVQKKMDKRLNRRHYGKLPERSVA